MTAPSRIEARLPDLNGPVHSVRIDDEVEAANPRLESCVVDFGDAAGIDYEGTDKDLPCEHAEDNIDVLAQQHGGRYKAPHVCREPRHARLPEQPGVLRGGRQLSLEQRLWATRQVAYSRMRALVVATLLLTVLALHNAEALPQSRNERQPSFATKPIRVVGTQGWLWPYSVWLSHDELLVFKGPRGPRDAITQTKVYSVSHKRSVVNERIQGYLGSWIEFECLIDSPQVSPDGKWLLWQEKQAVTGIGRARLRGMSLTGELASHTWAAFNGTWHSSCWMPDSRRLLCSDGRTTFLLDVRYSEESVRLDVSADPTNKTQRLSLAGVNRDGTGLAYLWDSEFASSFDLLTFAAQKGEQDTERKTVTLPRKVHVEQVTVSPSGDLLLIAGRYPSSGNLKSLADDTMIVWTCTIDGYDVQRLATIPLITDAQTHSPEEPGQVSWRPGSDQVSIKHNGILYLVPVASSRN